MEKSQEIESILITGAGGYVGTGMVGRALAMGYDVRAFDRYFFGTDKLGDSLQNHNLTVIYGDVRDIGLDVFRGVDAVIDLAGISNDPAADLDPVLTKSINFDGCARVASMAKEAGVKRFIGMSSCSVYGVNRGVCDERTPRNPLSLYARMKADVEDEVLPMSNNDFCVTMLRNSTAFGLSNRMRFDLVVNVMTLNAIKNRLIRIFGDGKQRRPLVAVSDVSKFTLALLSEPVSRLEGQIFNLGAVNLNMFAVAEEVRAGLVGLFENVDIETVPVEADNRDYEVSFDRFLNTFGFGPAESIREATAVIAAAIVEGRLNPDDLSCYTVRFYKSLIERYGSSLLQA